jgi:acyl-CoA thioesterase
MSGHGSDAPGDRARRIAERAASALYGSDQASRMLGMVIESVGPGTARVRMRVRPDMVNGHGVCHGGLIFALADSAFAFACNSHGNNAVAAGASIEFLAPGREGDLLVALASERWRRGRGGIYEIEVRNQHDEIVALFRGRSQQIAGRLVDE